MSMNEQTIGGIYPTRELPFKAVVADRYLKIRDDSFDFTSLGEQEEVFSLISN